jgi:hypothetical protein
MTKSIREIIEKVFDSRFEWEDQPFSRHVIRARLEKEISEYCLTLQRETVKRCADKVNDWLMRNNFDIRVVKNIDEEILSLLPTPSEVKNGNE